MGAVTGWLLDPAGVDPAEFALDILLEEDGTGQIFMPVAQVSVRGAAVSGEPRAMNKTHSFTSDAPECADIT